MPSHSSECCLERPVGWPTGKASSPVRFGSFRVEFTKQLNNARPFLQNPVHFRPSGNSRVPKPCTILYLHKPVYFAPCQYWPPSLHIWVPAPCRLLPKIKAPS